MNDAKDSRKSTHRPPAPPSRDERAPMLLARMRSLVEPCLLALCSAMFENVDDALFDLAEKAENNTVQTQYFDGMRDIRKHRCRIEQAFVDAVCRSLETFAVHHDLPAYDSGHGDDTPADTPLVDEEALEESLAIASIASRNESRLQSPLQALNRRLSLLCGGRPVDNANNPLTPNVLSRAFGTALQDVRTPKRVKLLLYKLFDRYVMGRLDNMYAALNSALAEAGILTYLTPAPALGYEDAMPELAATGTPADEDPRRAQLRRELMECLRQLLTTRRHALSRQDPVDVRASLSPAELLSALSLLQSQAARQHTDSPRPVDCKDAADPAQPLKYRLQQQIHHLRGNEDGRISGVDEDTIDLVGMLFDFILRDDDLPSRIRVLLARMQIPYLKVAILDRHLFAYGRHPARRLLDALAEASRDSEGDHAYGPHLYGKVRDIVDTLIRDFDDDLSIFARLLLDLQRFLAGHEKASTTTAASPERDTRRRARVRATQALRNRIGERSLPPPAHELLERAWINYMALLLLREGEDSRAFLSSLRFVDEFIWSLSPPRDIHGRRRMRQLQPVLERVLRHGLATAAFRKSDIDRLVEQLRDIRRQAERAGNGTADLWAGLAPLPATLVAQWPDFENHALPSASAPPSLHWPLRIGTWAQFTATISHGGELAKLVHIAPGGRHRFVNRLGRTVADLSPHELAAERASGRIMVLAPLPLFDRALDAIVDELRQQQFPSTAPPPHAP